MGAIGLSEYLKAVRASAACFMEMREGGVIVNGWREGLRIGLAGFLSILTDTAAVIWAI
ncbi:hypothetical protein [Paenibacillus sp. Marseille-P2973]|uniref:hypothetical protein n=1 Tax=Paenibacillus sp. Marseille-P2973 TaxID=1871032 RepID=UPI001B38EAB0|nr:hypothetical protein [Paenibacillus sp. Marseille-P2973]